MINKRYTGFFEDSLKIYRANKIESLPHLIILIQTYFEELMIEMIGWKMGCRIEASIGYATSRAICKDAGPIDHKQIQILKKLSTLRNEVTHNFLESLETSEDKLKTIVELLNEYFGHDKLVGESDTDKLLYGFMLLAVRIRMKNDPEYKKDLKEQAIKDSKGILGDY